MLHQEASVETIQLIVVNIIHVLNFKLRIWKCFDSSDSLGNKMLQFQIKIRIKIIEICYIISKFRIETLEHTLTTLMCCMKRSIPRGEFC